MGIPGKPSETSSSSDAVQDTPQTSGHRDKPVSEAWGLAYQRRPEVFPGAPPSQDIRNLVLPPNRQRLEPTSIKGDSYRQPGEFPENDQGLRQYSVHSFNSFYKSESETVVHACVNTVFAELYTVR